MKRFNLIFMALLGALTCVAQQQGVTTRDFSIHYHWGIINEVAGHGSMTMSLDGDQLTATLRGHSIPWDGRVYAISDTLVATVTPQNEVVSYINGWYTKPHVHHTADMSDPRDYRSIHGDGALNASDATMEAVSITADMLGIFYYSQVLDFPSMVTGQQTSIPITRPDGVPQTLTITYDGEGTCQCGCGMPTYDITFNYTYQGRPCSYDVHCQIGQETRFPTLISADITIGHVEMLLR